MRLSTLALFLALGATPAAADVFTFDTPSRNIGCSVGLSMSSSDIICTIHQRQGAPATATLAGCRAGHTFEMRNRGRVATRCGPGGSSDGFEVAPYGETGRFDGITCTSERTGLTCTNEDGHGFFLSRRAQRVF